MREKLGKKLNIERKYVCSKKWNCAKKSQRQKLLGECYIAKKRGSLVWKEQKEQCKLLEMKFKQVEAKSQK